MELQPAMLFEKFVGPAAPANLLITGQIQHCFPRKHLDRELCHDS